MKFNFFSKRKIFISIIFGACLSASFNSASAQTLQVVSTLSAVANQDLKVVIGTTPATEGMTIQFIPQSQSSISPFSPSSCKTSSNGSCFVNFRSSELGIFKAKVWGTKSGNIPNPSTDPSLNFDISVVSTPSISLTYAGNSKTNQNITVTAKTSDSKPNINISFAVNPATPEASFSPASCKTGDYGSCNVIFKSGKAGVFTPVVTATGYISSGITPITISNASTVSPNQASGINTDTSYTPLAPLPGFDKSFNTAEKCAFGKYLDIMISIFIGIAAVLAMVMIVLGGIEYMTSELISSKEHGKERITNAILGLIIALGSYALLNTINPRLLDKCLKLPEVQIVVTGPDSGDETIDPDFKKGVGTFSSDVTVSTGVLSAVEKLKQGWQISELNVYKNNTMLILLKKGEEIDTTNIISIAPGKNGYAAAGTAKTGDGKTPSGSWKILEIRYSPDRAQFNQKGSNMGAAFWLLDPMTSGERGIGIHGNKTGTLRPTIGCIRLKNSDLLALQPYIRTGITVTVQN